jgi:hypothetical protein
MAPAISLTVTGAAQSALREFLGHCEPGSVVTVVWWEGGATLKGLSAGPVQFQLTGPQWGVGSYPRSAIHESKIVTISGIEFYFGQGDISNRLNGKTLEYRAGRFHVE